MRLLYFLTLELNADTCQVLTVLLFNSGCGCMNAVRCYSAIVMVWSLTIAGAAHPGSTNANGCHYDTNGRYHMHEQPKAAGADGPRRFTPYATMLRDNPGWVRSTPTPGDGNGASAYKRNPTPAVKRQSSAQVNGVQAEDKQLSESLISGGGQTLQTGSRK